MSKVSAYLAALGLCVSVAACSSSSNEPSSPSPSTAEGEPSLEEAAVRYAELREAQEVPRLLAVGLVSDGFAEEDLEAAQEGVEAVIAELEDFSAALAEIEFPADVQEKADALVELSAEEVAALEESLSARTFEDFDSAYGEYVSLPVTAYDELRDALGDADPGIQVPDADAVYEDDFSDDSNSWELFEDDFAASRYVDGEFEISAVAGSFASAAPLDVHGFDRDRTLLSVDVEVETGPEDDSYSYGVTCPSESALDDGVHAELLGSGGYTFYRTDSSDPDGIQYYVFAPEALEQLELGEENRMDVLCSQSDDRTVVQLWVNGAYVDGTSFPYELPSRDAPNADGALTATVDPGAPSGVAVRFDDWAVSVASSEE